MKKQDWIIETLISSGKRITKNRKQVSQWIFQHEGLFSPQDIIGALPELDRVGIYRTLELLAELDCIHEAGIQNGHTMYEKHNPNNHHHHIICTKCKKTACVPCHFATPEVHGFFDIHHVVQLHGECHACHRSS